ncbi:ribonuclease P protein component [Nocardia sp. NPDC004068]|uniref:ribonuclease P protein component n=1 Tax=Nocardia sp. NPDC004068 TaxID=3364303 RepID=UPI0036BB49C2
MLPEPYRLHHRSDFSRTVRHGRRLGRRDLVVHVLLASDVPVRFGGPRFGLIVSKAVGNAVIRHRVARRLRHMCGPLIDELPEEADVVIRALPGAAHAPAADLERQLRGALRKLVPNVAVAEPVSAAPESGGTS